MGFDINKPYRTRSGLDAFVVALPTGSFAGAIVDGPCTFARVWSGEGRVSAAHKDDGEEHFDLVNFPEKRTVKVWMNIYDDSRGVIVHLKPDTAAMYAGRDRIACIERDLSFEVGEGV